MGAAKHLLADIGNRAAPPRRRTGQTLHRTGGKPGLVADHDGDDRAARLLLFVRNEVGDLGHRHDRDLPPQAFLEPFLRGALLQPWNELAFDFFHALQAIGAHEQRRVVAQRVQPQHLAERAPLRGRNRRNPEPALFGLVDADRKGRPEAVDADPPHDVAARKRLEHDVFGHGDRGLEDAQAARAPAPVLHAAERRRGGGDETPETGEDAGLEVRRVHRRAICRADQFYQSRQRANGRVSRGEICIRSLAAEPACLEMDQSGIGLPDRLEVDRRTIRSIDVTTVEQDVAGADQFRQARGGVRIVRVERDARFVEIEKRKPRAVSSRRQRRGAAKRIAVRRLDFPDGGAEIGEQTGAVACRCAAPDLDNSQMRQRAHHAPSWPHDQRDAAGAVSCCRT